MNSRILFFFVRSLVLLTSFFLGSCTAITEKNLLKFPVKALQEEPKTEKIPAEKVTADIRDLTGFAVDEDVLITTSMFGSDYGLDVFDRTSGKILHPLCRIGRGPGEFLSIFSIPARKEEGWQGIRCRSISYSAPFRFPPMMKGQKRDKNQIYQIKEPSVRMPRSDYVCILQSQI